MCKDNQHLLEVTHSHLLPYRPQNINVHKYTYMGDLTILMWQILYYKHGSSNFPSGTWQASKYKYIQYIYMDDPTIFTSKINNIYVDTSFSFCLVIFVRTRFKFFYNRINFQINMSFHQFTQHGFIRHMRNDTHKHPWVLQPYGQKTHEVTFQKQFALCFQRTYKQKTFEMTFQKSLPGTSTGHTNKKTHEVTFQKQFVWCFHRTYKWKNTWSNL